MKPPKTINVLDEHSGFTAITTRRGDTLWRPVAILRGRPSIGELVSYTEKSFYQNNNDVTYAKYKVNGYRCKVGVWFDNRTGRRIA